ncbi:MAG: hypothetical protein M1816_007757 [Peltula sp. TS41687]|nr:MAG: hypothetical protein M1816_007757 [Peltula sp. TS41687]
MDGLPRSRRHNFFLVTGTSSDEDEKNPRRRESLDQVQERRPKTKRLSLFEWAIQNVDDGSGHDDDHPDGTVTVTNEEGRGQRAETESNEFFEHSGLSSSQCMQDRDSDDDRTDYEGLGGSTSPIPPCLIRPRMLFVLSRSCHFNSYS